MGEHDDVLAESYRTLGVDAAASPQELRDAYLIRVQILHPDRLQAAPDKVRAEAERQLKQVNAAYDLLKRASRERTRPAGTQTASPSEPAPTTRERTQREHTARDRAEREQAEREQAARRERAHRERVAGERAAYVARKRRWIVSVAAIVFVAALVVAVIVRSARNNTDGAGASNGSSSDLLDASYGWDSSSSCLRLPDGLHIVGDAGTCLSNIDVADFDAAVTVRTVTGGRAGISFRWTTSMLGYIFQITGSGAWRVTGFTGDLLPLASNPAIRQGTGAMNRLRAHADGTELRFFVNERLVGEVRDDHFTAGKLGLWGYSGGQTTNEMVFSELTIKAL